MMLHTLDRLRSMTRIAAFAAGVSGLLCSPVAAQQIVNLIAAPTTIPVAMPDGTSVMVPMWGFALDVNGNGLLDGSEAPTVPGPRIVVTPGTATLTINLKNLLPESVSIMVPGQQASGVPVIVDGRVRSLAPEAAASGGLATYTFDNLKSGTFLYHSASHPAVQVQMGLYGALTRDESAGIAYAGVPFANEVVLVYSEIDLALHNAVAAGTYGVPSAGGPTSTIDYDPSLFLINGVSYTGQAAPIPAGVTGSRTLIRLLNAGLASHVPVVSNASLLLVAEDGNKYADARMQTAVLLPAGKTHDAIWMPADAGDFPVYDRALRLQAGKQAAGGMLATLHVELAGGPPASTVTGVADSYSTAEDAQLIVPDAAGVLANDTGAATSELYANPSSGTLALNPLGGFTYTPGPNFSGFDAFMYRARNGSDTSAPTLVTISVAPMQDPPVAFPIAIGVDAGGSKPVTLGGSDPDGDPLSFYVTDLPAHGTLTISNSRKIDIASIAVGVEGTVTTTVPHGLTTGDFVYLAGTSTTPAVDGNRIVTVTSAQTFTIPVEVTAGQAAAGGLVQTVTRRALAAADLFTSAATPGTAIPAGSILYSPAAGYPAGATAAPDVFHFRAGDGQGPGAGNVSAPAVVDVSVQPEVTDATPGTAITLTVLGVDPRAPAAAPVTVTDYKWTLEEDRTYQVVPGVLDPNTLSVSFHKSYMPVVQSGDQTTSPRVESGKRYFVSVLPKEGGYANGGAPIAVGQSAVTVRVNKGPTPTGQIRIHVFEDTSPLNGQFDADEGPLAGFNVGIDDAGGRYGIAGGQIFQDAFGNPIGTTYKPCPPPGPCESYEVDQLGNGFVLTDANGYATISNLRPGKYTVKVIPPADQAYQQTTTIEGQKGQDAWIKANEPPFFTEFGPPGPHVEIGFVRPMQDAAFFTGTRSITGTITNLHQSRPPDFTMFSGAPFDFTRAWVALNEGIDGALRYAQPTNEDGTFSIENVPDGTYTLGIFDSALDFIFASKAVTVGSTSSQCNASACELGDIPVFPWFTRLYHFVFEDINRDGIRQEGERGIREVPLNTRWRDGSIFQSSATDGSGFLPFEETFPFFAWQIAEVDYGRFRPTGATVIVDNGGDPGLNTTWPDAAAAPVDSRVLVPQPQVKPATWADNEFPSLGGNARTELGPVLLEGFQGFVGQTSVFMWGKAPYDVPGTHPTDVNNSPFDVFCPAGPGLTLSPDYMAGRCTTGNTNDVDWNANGKFDTDEFHGGITGIVHYSTTRAENNARWGTPEVWEPGIAAVRVQLWDSTRTRLLNEVRTDSWDDAIPAGCQGPTFSYLGQPRDCYDGLRNWNQARPAVFDGGYAFYTILESPTPGHEYDLPLGERTVEKPLPAGDFVVKVIVPRGYTLVKEEDKNVDFGEEYIPAEFYLIGYPLADAGGGGASPPREGALEDPLYAPFCVGSLHPVPAELSLFPGVPAAYGGDLMPLCDEKLVKVRNGTNPAANFFFLTEAPIAGHIIGFVLDDTSNEFDPNSPQFGEKYAPPFLPVSIHDWTGREISRTYTDRYGVYNALVPSTFTASTAIPSGMTPGMLTACINSPLLENGTPDPFHNKQYSQFCYTLQYMPGTTTYLDTPVVPTGAFAGPGQATLDAELPDMTPVIFSVTQGTSAAGGIGPYIVNGTAAQRTITIKSAGPTQVTNPAFDPNLPNGAGNPNLITRDYGFGAVKGQLWVGSTQVSAASITTWNDGLITATIPAGTPTGQVKVVRCLDGAACAVKRDTVMGVTLTVQGMIAALMNPPRTVAPGGSIQAAIDAAQPGELILVAPGTYQELVVMDKPVRLQGWGAPSTIINAVKKPAEKTQAWRDRVLATVTAQPQYLLAFQNANLTIDPSGEVLGPVLGGEGAAITVLARNLPLGGVTCPQLPRPATPQAFGLQMEGTAFRSKARIDGFGITGSDAAAGIEVNAFACNLEVLNNRIFSNMGDFGAAVKIGHPGAVPELADDPARNDFVTVAFNHILQNTSMSYDAGGAIAIGSGARSYSVKYNFVAGNLTFGRGAGIAHIGLSEGGEGGALGVPASSIDHNTIVFNEVFNQDSPRAGGGIYVGGRLPVGNDLTPGSGHVVVSNNLIQGNAAIGDGGGLALQYVNGAEGAANRYRIDVFGNTIVNNVAGLAGAGIALQDAVNVQIFHTTIAHNDSLAVGGPAFLNGPNTSTAQPSGIVSRSNSSQLGPIGGVNYSNPAIWNSIVWQNRSFYFGPCANPQDPGCTLNLGQGPAVLAYRLFPSTAGPGHPAPPYWDFGVIGAAGNMNMSYSVATALAGAGVPAATNSTAAPAFIRPYDNGDRRQTIVAPDVASAIPVPAAFDEGGNFIRAMFGPLTLNRLDNGLPYGDYHVTAAQNGQPLYTGQIAATTGRYTNSGAVPNALRADADYGAGDSRVLVGVYPTIGADQLVPLGPPTVSVNDASASEGNSGTTLMTFMVTLSRAITNPVTVRYSTTNGTASGGAAACTPTVTACDYVTLTNSALNSLTFAPGETSKPVNVTIKGDTFYEPNETFVLNVALAPGETDATILDGQGTGTIVNDDPVPTLSIDDVSVVEGTSGTSNMVFTVTLTGAHAGAATVGYITQDNTATGALFNFPAGVPDYLFRIGILSFPATTASTQTLTISVPIVGDTRVEPNETFYVNLALPMNAVIVKGTGIGTIINND